MKLFLRYDCHGILIIHLFTEERDSALQKRERIGASFLY